jgi:hypothetical protein
MQFVTDYDKGILGKPDPQELWFEIIDKIPLEIFARPDCKVLFPACGHGTEADIVAKIMLGLGKTAEQVKNSLYLIDKYKVFTNDAKKRGYTQVFKCDFLDWQAPCDFDVVLANPPFQDSADRSSYTNLWSRIYVKGFETLKKNGYLAMVTPRTWATPKNEGRGSQTSHVQNIISNHAVYVNIDECKRHFNNIGSTFTYSVVSKQSTKGQSVTLKTNIDEFQVNDFSEIVNSLPKNISKESISIFKKVLSKPFFEKEQGTTPKGNMIHDRDLTDKNRKLFPYKVQYSAGTVKWSDTASHLQYHKKIIWANQSAKDYPIYDPGECAPANRGAVYLVNSDEEGINFVDYIRSKLMQFIISEQRFHHGMLNTRVISSIPKIDLSRKWSDQELYEYFGLTSHEIDFIQTTCS